MISLGLLVRTMCNLITHCIALYICENTLKKNSDFLSFDRSNVPLDRSKKLKNSNSTFSLSIDRKSWNSNFQNFSKAVFFVFHEQTFNIWTLQTEIDVKTEFYWCYSLKIQFNILKFKFKQHHNINFSFHQIIVSTTCRKLKSIIF